jgi:hypothetical protein
MHNDITHEITSFRRIFAAIMAHIAINGLGYAVNGLGYAINEPEYTFAGN